MCLFHMKVMVSLFPNKNWTYLVPFFCRISVFPTEQIMSRCRSANFCHKRIYVWLDCTWYRVHMIRCKWVITRCQYAWGVEDSTIHTSLYTVHMAPVVQWIGNSISERLELESPSSLCIIYGETSLRNPEMCMLFLNQKRL